jgi:hypothetical protein
MINLPEDLDDVGLTSSVIGDLYCVRTEYKIPVWDSAIETKDMLQVGSVNNGEIVMSLGKTYHFGKGSKYLFVLTSAGVIGWIAGYVLISTASL